MRAQLLQILDSICSERLLMEEMDYNLLFRWSWACMQMTTSDFVRSHQPTGFGNACLSTMRIDAGEGDGNVQILGRKFHRPVIRYHRPARQPFIDREDHARDLARAVVFRQCPMVVAGAAFSKVFFRRPFGRRVCAAMFVTA